MRQDSFYENILPLRDENVEQTIIQNLTPYTKYEVLVNPFNKIGPGPASSKAIVSTLEGGKIFQSSHFHFLEISIDMMPLYPLVLGFSAWRSSGVRTV